MQETDTILEVRGLSTVFRSREGVVTAVRDVSFSLRQGDKMGIVGESGSGKSALALSLIGLIEPPGCVTGGEVRLAGRVISGLPDKAMQRIRGHQISLIFQDPMTALDPIKTIGDQVMEAIRHHHPETSRKAARHQAVELLREVEIPLADRRLDDYPHQYSGGMRQRVMIAIALANRPAVLIADEPTTSLDVTTQAQILDLLDRLVHETNTSVIFITHNLGIVAEFCDVVHVMYAGRFVEEGAVEQLFRHPVHPYTESLLRCVPRPDRLVQGNLASIPGFPPNLAALPPGCSFEPRCPLGHGREICRSLAPPRVKVRVDTSAVAAECHFAQERVAVVEG